MAKKTTKTSGLPTQEQVRNAFQELYNQLRQAYWAASTIEAKDQIYGVKEVVYDILLELQKEKIESDTPRYKEIKGQIEAATKKIDALRKEIDTIVHAVKIAGAVAKGIDKAIELARKFVGL